MASDPNEKVPEQKFPPSIRKIRIFSYPKIIFIWPTMVFALICGIGMLIVGDEDRAAARPAAEAEADADLEEPLIGEADEEVPPPARRFASTRNILGVIFLLVFAVNMLVMALDFPRFTLIAVILFVALVVVLLMYLASIGVDFLSPLTSLSRYLYFSANAAFYLAIAAILGVMFATIWATRYLDFWEIRPNEVLHHHGPLSDLERYPTLHLKFDKEIPDILEYLLGLGSGRLVLYFGTDQRHVVLDHVLFINAKEEALKNLMGRLQVQIHQQGGGPGS